MNSFATPGPITAVVSIPAGVIQLTAADSDTTTVQIGPADPAKGRDVKLAEQTTAHYSDGTLQVVAPAGHRLLGSSGALEVTVQLPAGSRVQARGASIRFTTTGPLGDVALDSAQATVRIDHAATARLTSADGDITVGHLDGDAEIRTARGDIQVGEATRGALTLVTQVGAITVGAAAGVSATLDARTTLGRVDNALANAGTPGLAIHATTTTGDVTARSL
ncbi:MAG TPA: DUF4097 family beta strand repeat-containing protein [Streptosporangiaceae bacterium]